MDSHLSDALKILTENQRKKITHFQNLQKLAAIFCWINNSVFGNIVSPSYNSQETQRSTFKTNNLEYEANKIAASFLELWHISNARLWQSLSVYAPPSPIEPKVVVVLLSPFRRNDVSINNIFDLGILIRKILSF